jgi:hypothetical protein
LVCSSCLNFHILLGVEDIIHFQCQSGKFCHLASTKEHQQSELWIPCNMDWLTVQAKRKKKEEKKVVS